MDEPGNLSNSTNPHIQDVIARRFSRRSLLTSLVAAGAVAGLGAAFPLRQVLAAGGSTLAFKSLALTIDEKHHVADGYTADLVIGWGHPVAKGAKPLDLASQTAASQAGQFGYNCDFIGYFPLPLGSASSEHGLLFVNHEYTNGELMRPGVKSASENRTKADKAWTEVEMAAHGGAVVEVRKQGGAWKYVAESSFNRRITGTTECGGSRMGVGERLRCKQFPRGLTPIQPSPTARQGRALRPNRAKRDSARSSGAARATACGGRLSWGTAANQLFLLARRPGLT